MLRSGIAGHELYEIRKGYMSAWFTGVKDRSLRADAREDRPGTHFSRFHPIP